MKNSYQLFGSKLYKTSILLILFVFNLSIFSCKDNPSGTEDDLINDQNSPRTDLPAELAGSWYAGNISGVNFYNPGTGVWGAPSGPGMFFNFTADGYYEKGVLLQSSLYNCTSSFLAYNKGTVTKDGDRITLHPTYGRIKSEDNCVSDNNYEKDDDLSQETIIWYLGTDDYNNEVLYLSYENGNPSVFYRR